MDNTAQYLMEYQKLAMDQLDYLSKRMYQRKALDEEIELLYRKAKWDYSYICSILDGTTTPPIQEADPSASPTVINAIPPKPAAYNPKSSQHTRGRARPVIQLDLDGTVIQRFESIKAASLATGIQSPYISTAANTNSYTRDGSFWRFEDNYGYLEKNRPVVVASEDGVKKNRYNSSFEAAKDLGVPFNHFQIILHTKSHKDDNNNLYYWYEDEYNFVYGLFFQTV